MPGASLHTDAGAPVTACADTAVKCALLACRRADRDGTHKLYSPDGSIEAAYDDTSRPLYDTRVWLHMYEGPRGQLLPSFCRRTGAAQYMYDFTGFTEWRVERNALLSDDAKCLMFKLWTANRDVWPEETLATVFKIRVQRALAIVKIKEREFKHVRSPAPSVLPGAMRAVRDAAQWHCSCAAACCIRHAQVRHCRWWCTRRPSFPQVEGTRLPLDALMCRCGCARPVWIGGTPRTGWANDGREDGCRRRSRRRT